ncbi:MAG: transposase [Thermodesulfobacteriota bacterium]|nr:transposase [Thermodesulfobacteriota bacterium]
MKRRKFDKSFKLEVVHRSMEDISLKQLGEELGIHPNIISRWRKEFLDSGEQLSFPGHGKEALTEEQKQIKRLNKELADAKLETEILKKAIRIFSKSDGKSTLL